MMTPAERGMVARLEARLAGLERRVTSVAGAGVSSKGGPVQVRTTQLGFPAELTAAWDATNGYAWKRLRLEGVTTDEPGVQPAGVQAVTPDGNEDLEAGTRGWMEPSPDAQGWYFVASGSGSGGDDCLTDLSTIEPTDCLSVRAADDLDTDLNAVWSDTGGSEEAGGWVVEDTIDTNDGAATATLIEDERNRLMLELVGDSEEPWYIHPTGRCHATYGTEFAGRSAPRASSEGSGSGFGAEACAGEALRVWVKCAACPVYYCCPGTGVVVRVRSEDELAAFVCPDSGDVDPGGLDPEDPSIPPCAIAPARIRINMSSTVPCIGVRTGTADRTGSLPYTYAAEMGYTDCSLDAGAVLSCGGSGWGFVYDSNGYTLIAASVSPFMLTFRYTGPHSGGNPDGTTTVTITEEA